MAIDNGHAERLLKSPCLGENNDLFFGSDGGAEVAAGYYTLIASAKAYGHNPEVYLRDVWDRISNQLYHSLDDLLPENWQPQNIYESKHIVVKPIKALYQQAPCEGRSDAHYRSEKTEGPCCWLGPLTALLGRNQFVASAWRRS